MKGNHCGHCSITHSPVDPLAPPLFMINCCQLSPRGLNWQVNQTDHLPGGICGTDDEAQSSLISALTLVHVGNHWTKDSCGVAGSSPRLCLCYSFCIDMGACSEKHAQRAHCTTSVWGWGDVRGKEDVSLVTTQRQRGRNLPSLHHVFFPYRVVWNQTCEVEHVKWGDGVYIYAGGIGTQQSGGMHICQCKPTHTRIHPRSVPIWKPSIVRRAEEKPRATVNGWKVP